MTTTAKDAVKESVPGLPQAPEGGKFLVRKVAETTEESPSVPGVQPDTTYTRELVLVVKGEKEYKVPLYTYDDSTIINGTYQVTALRRAVLREDLITSNDEVELTN